MRRLTMMGGSLTLFHVRGIPVRVHVSWLVIYGLIAWSLAVGYFPRVLPDTPLLTHWVTGLVAALLLFVSVFLHELSHALVARRHGLGVSAITLHIFGGVSQLDDEPPSPAVEFWIAIVGPLTSFAIALVAGVAAWATRPFEVLAAILGYLAFVNGVVGAFNLVPGFPLDGGRVLRAALWKIKGDLGRATAMASRAGGAVAVLLMALGVVRGMAGDFLGGLWFVLIGVFLQQAGRASYQQLLVRRTLEPLTVRDVMTRDVVHIAADVPVARAADDVFWRHHVSSVPVVTGDRVVGILSLRQLRDLPRERWAGMAVSEVMQPIEASLTAAPGDDLWTAFQKLSTNGLGRLAVVDSGRLVGYLSAKDVLHTLAVSTAGARGDGSSAMRNTTITRPGT
jgi:Zn-dependent protease/predicted transcriptional regulator